MARAVPHPPAGPVDRLDLPALDAKWQRVWAERGTYRTDMEARRPFYCLMMFPYPSAEKLHIGNAYAFTGADVYGRYMRQRGHEVFEPLGFDAFGIHSENYALKVGEHPATLTARNVEHFRERQLKKLGLGVDWSHEVDTTDPRYYRWTQWVFLQLFKAGLAEHREGPVNWCPSCLTVLADEQVIAGRCERCGSEVQTRFLKQWFIKTTHYAQEMLDALDTLDWSERTKLAQRNWIGRSEGALIDFRLRGCGRDQVTVFTTRPDTLYGATFLVVGADHPELLDFAGDDRRAAVEEWRTHLPVAEAEPDFAVGIDLGSRAVHPLTGAELPVLAAPYVLGSYGTGAIMAVPGHDERDWRFARAHRLPIVEVITGGDVSVAAWTGEGAMVNSGPLDGTWWLEGKQRVVEMLEAHGAGRAHVQFRLRDWIISRQRYWGPPIPIIHCPVHGPVAVPEADLPVLLPEVPDFRPLGTGVSPLAQAEAWVNVPCPIGGEPARRETDVNDNFLDSGWYFLRYPSTDFDDRAMDHDRTWRWLPVDMYIGGHEHAVLHLMYARFLMRALHALGHVPGPEPFTRFRAHGLLTLATGKMSKSRGNVVNPDDYMARFGADTLRLHLMFLGPYLEGGEWNEGGMIGQSRFLERVWRSVPRCEGDAAQDPERERRRHRTIARVQRSIEELHYNTAISALHELQRGIDDDLAAGGGGRRIDARTLVQLLAPFAPHLAEELWERLGEPGSVHRSAWPEHDPALAAETRVTIAVQVNGRLRATFECDAGAPAAELERLAREQPRVVELLAGRAVRQVIAVPDRVVNLVV
jgi:leucyl-tRNA synthetase